MSSDASPSRAIAPLDLLILGGGIAGLWTLARARRAGYRALLLENRALGGLQTLAAQGIIHGGTKYALGGRLSAAAQAVAEMPDRWRACLAGRGELDLRGVRLLSPHQYLWSDQRLGSRLAAFLGSRLMRGRVTPLNADRLPAPFDHPAFRGRLYRLDEPVLDLPSLIAELHRQVGDACGFYRPGELRLEVQGVRLGNRLLAARRVLLAAGAGNAELVAAAGLPGPAMQRRPLHMVMARGALPSLFAHALEADHNPRLTVTSYPLADGRRLWYLGGNLAEKGVERSRAEQIEAARAELAELLPWVDGEALEWATFAIDRAEVATAGGRRPDDCYLARHGRYLVAWPTKLALAPRLADQVLDQLGPPLAKGPLPELPPPPLARPPWEEVRWN